MRTLCLLVCLLPFSAAAEDVTLPGESAFDYCITCHGTEGRGNQSINAPRIGGMEDWYLENQLVAFRNGWRGVHPDDYHGGEMRPMAVALDGTSEVREAAEHFAAFEAVETRETVEGDTTAGAQLYATCVTCHGAQGQGNEALSAPALARQSDWYLVRQLEHYRAGVRGSDPDDTTGQQMRAMAGVLVDEQAIRDVVAYINTLD